MSRGSRQSASVWLNCFKPNGPRSSSGAVRSGKSTEIVRLAHDLDEKMLAVVVQPGLTFDLSRIGLNRPYSARRLRCAPRCDDAGL